MNDAPRINTALLMILGLSKETSAEIAKEMDRLVVERNELLGRVFELHKSLEFASCLLAQSHDPTLRDYSKEIDKLLTKSTK